MIIANILPSPSSCSSWNGTKSFDSLFHNYTNLNGTTKYVIDNDSDYYSLLHNGSLNSSFDFPVLWTYPQFTSGKRFYHGVMSVGQSVEYDRLNTKLSTNATVNIVAVGGSVTCGRTLNRWYPDSPRWDLNSTWPKYLEINLRHHYACHSSSCNPARITVHNLCISGAGVNVWVDKVLEWRQIKSHILNVADVVIIEAALNDAALIWGFQNDIPGFSRSRFGPSRDVKKEGKVLGRSTPHNIHSHDHILPHSMSTPY